MSNAAKLFFLRWHVTHREGLRWAIAILLIIAGLAGQGRGAYALPRTAADSLTAADRLYEGNRFEQAIPYYRGLLAGHGTASARMLQRMSLIAETQGHVPEALYYMSLLYNLAPDEALRGRMESLARQYQLEGYDYDEQDFIRTLLRGYAGWAFGVFVLVVLALMVVLFLRRRQGRPLRLLPLAVLLALAAASALLNVEIHYGKAIVVGGQSPMMAAPSAASALLARVPAGTRLTVTGQTDVWMHITYAGRTGYVNRYGLEYF